MKRSGILLCGFMGCGKSTVGQSLAKQLSLPFTDADCYIEEKSGLSIGEIFVRFGEAHFRALEADCVRALAASGGAVIALGGGALGNADTVQAAREGGVLVYLQEEFEVCWQRIRNSGRPLVLRSTKAELETLYTQRLPVYEGACHLRVRGMPSARATAESILREMAQAGWQIGK